jgi:hypothetical protein
MRAKDNLMRPIRLLTATALAVTLAGAGVPAWAQAQAQDPHHPAPMEQAAPDQPQAAPGAGTPMPGMMGGGPGTMPGRMGMMPGMGGPGMMMPPGMGMMQGGPGGMAGPGQPMAMPEETDDPVAAAFQAINRRMHREMAAASSGVPDRDFAVAMIAHHQGAIDMAKVELGFGSDPEIRKLAEEIIAAQEREVAFLQEWLQRQGQ